MMYESNSRRWNESGTYSRRLRSGLGTLPSIFDHEFREFLLSRALQSINDASQGHCRIPVGRVPLG